MTTIRISDKDFNLSLPLEELISLEKELGYNPIEMFIKTEQGTLPKTGDLIIFLKHCLVRYNHGINNTQVMGLFQEYLKDGHEMFDIVPVLVEVMQDSGLIGSEKEDESKN